jgi:DNA-binding NtrC family response regulator
MASNIVVYSTEEIVSRRLAVMVQDEGLTVHQANSAGILEKIVRETETQLLIVDFYLSARDLAVLVQHIRNLPNGGQLRVLVLMYADQVDKARQWIDDPKIDFLPKPILHFNLVSKVIEMLPH